MRMLRTQVELKKTKRMGLPYLIVGFVFLALFIGTTIYLASQSVFEEMSTQWLALWGQSGFYYSQIFFPILIGLIVSLVSREETERNNWQQMKSMGLSISKQIIAKFNSVVIYIFSAQLLFTSFFLVIAFVLRFPYNFNILLFLLWSIAGWVGSFSIISIQLFLSVFFNNFTTPIIVSIILSIGGFLAVMINEKLLYVYPYSQVTVGLRSRFLTNFTLSEIFQFALINFIFTFLFICLSIRVVENKFRK